VALFVAPLIARVPCKATTFPRPFLKNLNFSVFSFFIFSSYLRFSPKMFLTPSLFFPPTTLLHTLNLPKDPFLTKDFPQAFPKPNPVPPGSLFALKPPPLQFPPTLLAYFPHTSPTSQPLQNPRHKLNQGGHFNLYFTIRTPRTLYLSPPPFSTPPLLFSFNACCFPTPPPPTHSIHHQLPFFFTPRTPGLAKPTLQKTLPVFSKYVYSFLFQDFFFTPLVSLLSSLFLLQTQGNSLVFLREKPLSDFLAFAFVPSFFLLPPDSFLCSDWLLFFFY